MSDITKLTYVVGAKRLQEKNRDTEYLLSQEQLEMFANLVRVDAIAKEREALENIDWTALMRYGASVTWDDAIELGDRVVAAIRARGQK